jgi:hypothetical protein
LITTLFVTIFIESIVVTGAAIWWKKPLAQILITSLVANLITQSILWVVLNIFIQHYLINLFLAEFCIWIIESAALYLYQGNKLKLLEAVLLSLAMNLASFGLGWFLPI